MWWAMQKLQRYPYKKRWPEVSGYKVAYGLSRDVGRGFTGILISILSCRIPVFSKVEDCKGESILAQIMTTKEMAKYLRLHQITICKLSKEGKIPAIQIGRVWRFDKEVIDEWIAKG